MTHTNLARRIDQWTRGIDGGETSIPGLALFRRENRTEPELCLLHPSIIVVAQGAKQMFVGGEPHRYDASTFLVTSLDLPAQSQVIEAEPDMPCLGLSMKLDLRIMGELIAQTRLMPPGERSGSKGMTVGALTPAILQPFERLLELLDEPDSIPVLCPLITREIHYRLLTSDHAARLWQIFAVGSPIHRIATVIDWLKANYTKTFRVEELAERAQMSPSTFHQHFRELTTMSPLQYQKWLRLNEARRLMLGGHLDAAGAAFEVGYESPSQFSREYSRHFGAPPKRDVAYIRKRPDVAVRGYPYTG
jgi:AraC-like DNA-binding protein